MKYVDQEGLIKLFQLTYSVMLRQTEGISNEQSVIQPPVRGNCMNWVLGHILMQRDLVLKLLKMEPVWDAATCLRYTRESEPVTHLEDGVPFDRMLADLALTQERIESGLQTITAEALEETVETNGRKDRAGGQIAFIHWHETYHTGQLELLRQFAGKDDKVI